MAKWCGKIGFAETVEVEPGVWDDDILERRYQGELLRHTRNQSVSGNVVEDITISNQISVLSDLYARKNHRNIKYVEFEGTKWRVSVCGVEYPRLILTLGGVYNGK